MSFRACSGCSRSWPTRGTWNGPGVAATWFSRVCFVLGLLSKPMVVTLPFVLLLLDVWPLRRWSPGEGGESRVAPVAREGPADRAGPRLGRRDLAQSRRAAGPWDPAPTGRRDLRLANAAVSYVAYLGAAVWPVRLACFYPHPGLWGGPSVLLAAGAGALLAALTALALFLAKRRPYGFVGWAWFLGTLVPAIGVVQVGYQARADRYTYLPLIGIGIVLAWSLEGWVGRRAARRRVLVVAGSLVLVVLAVADAAAARLLEGQPGRCSSVRSPSRPTTTWPTTVWRCTSRSRGISAGRRPSWSRRWPSGPNSPRPTTCSAASPGDAAT